MTNTPSIPVTDRPLRIACVHTDRNVTGEVVGAMNMIRFLRMAEALQRRGHDVHVVSNGSTAGLPLDSRVRAVRPTEVRWDDYDVGKTTLHSGFAALAA